MDIMGLKKGNFMKYGEILGGVVWLASYSAYHSSYTIIDISRYFAVPISLGQSRLFIDKDDIPYCFVTWAWLTDKQADDFKNNKLNIQDNEWNLGHNLWFMDFIAPFGRVDKIIAELQTLRQSHFRNADAGYSVRRDADRQVKSVKKWL